MAGRPSSPAMVEPIRGSFERVSFDQLLAKWSKDHPSLATRDAKVIIILIFTYCHIVSYRGRHCASLLLFVLFDVFGLRGMLLVGCRCLSACFG
jgi:hypothetical protein